MANDGNSYLTTDKLITLVSTLLAVIVPLIGFVAYLDNRFNNLTNEIAGVRIEVNSLKRTVKCTVMAIEKGYNVEVCDIDEAYL